MYSAIDPLLQIDDLVVVVVGIHLRWWSPLPWTVDAKPIAIEIKIVAEIKKQELHFAISWKGIYTNKLSFSLGFLKLMVSVGFYSLSIKMVLCCVCKWAYKVSQQLRLTELKTWATIHDWLWCCVLFTKLPFLFF
jgi:hypothetical protein